MRNSFVLFAALFMAVCLCFVSCGGAVSNESSVPETPSGSSSEESSIDNSEEPSSEQTVSEGSAEETSEESNDGGFSEVNTDIPLLTDEDVSFLEGSEYRFTSDKYPGKVLLHDKRYGVYEYYPPYPLYIVDEILKEFAVDNKSVTIFNGRYADLYAGGPEISEKKCTCFIYDDCVERLDRTDYNMTVVGKALLLSVPESDGGLLYLFGNGTYDLFQVDVTDMRGGTEKIIVHDWMLDTAHLPDWIIIDTDGNYYSLPVPDEYRWSVEEIAFDTESEDPDAVIVKYYENGELKTVKANLKDTRIVSVDDYYDAVNPDYEWDGDE